jgi:hypothetical protein
MVPYVNSETVIDDSWLRAHRVCEESSEFRSKHPEIKTVSEWIEASLSDNVPPRWGAWLVMRATDEDHERQERIGKMFGRMCLPDGIYDPSGGTISLHDFVSGRLKVELKSPAEDWLREMVKEFKS